MDEYLHYSMYLEAVITALIVILNTVVVCIIARRKKITRLYCYLLNLAIAGRNVIPTTKSKEYTKTRNRSTQKPNPALKAKTGNNLN